MSNINLYQSYNNKLRKFGVNDNDRFKLSFVEAVNLVYAEINDQVFQNQTLDYIDYFNDVIDTRLVSFDTITYDSAVGGADDAIENREYWSMEWELEKTSATNTFSDAINDTTNNFTASITNNVLTVNSTQITGTLTLPTVDVFTLKFVSDNQGNHVYIDDDKHELVYTLGDESVSQPIGTVTSHIIGGTTGFEIKRTRFLSSGTVIYDFPFDEEVVNTGLTDEISGYTALIAGTPILWDDRWVEPSSGLDSQYRSIFDMGMDYHLQDGGEWAIEPEPERERKWYTRGINMARNIYQNNSTYTNPLGI